MIYTKMRFVSQAVILLPNPNATSALVDDEALCIVATHVRRFTDDACLATGMTADPVRIVLVLNQQHHAVFFEKNMYGAVPKAFEDECEVLSLQEIGLQALAKGLLIPGFGCFIANLTAHVDGLSKRTLDQAFAHASDDWMKEYFTGYANELYKMPFEALAARNPLLDQMPFEHLAAYVYSETNCLLLRYGNEHGGTTYEILTDSLPRAIEVCQRVGAITQEELRDKDIFSEARDLLKQAGTTKASLIKQLDHDRDDANAVIEEMERDLFLRLTFKATGFEAAYGGSLREFASRHHVINPNKRPDKGGPDGLLQEIGSEALESLDGHTILIGGQMLQIPHFVRVLRTFDMRKDRMTSIVIVSKEDPHPDVVMILKMFINVYVVVLPEDDNNNLSLRTLKAIQIHKASAAVFAASHGDDVTETGVKDFHQLCIRMMVRSLNSECKTIVEVDDYSQVRYFVIGSPESNAWSDTSKIQESFHTNVAKQWIRRMKNDMLLPLITAGVHKSRSGVLLKAMLGGSQFDFALNCIDLPAEYVGRTYKELLLSMCYVKHIPLALYRQSITDHQMFVYTNPLPDTVLRADDKVYLTTYLKEVESEDAGGSDGLLTSQAFHIALQAGAIPPNEMYSPHSSKNATAAPIDDVSDQM